MVVITVAEEFPVTVLPGGPVCIGLGDLPAVCWVRRALAAAAACCEVMFVAIPVLKHLLPTGLICEVSHLLQKSSIY